MDEEARLWQGKKKEQALAVSVQIDFINYKREYIKTQSRGIISDVLEHSLMPRISILMNNEFAIPVSFYSNEVSCCWERGLLKYLDGEYVGIETHQIPYYRYSFDFLQSHLLPFLYADLITLVADFLPQ